MKPSLPNRPLRRSSGFLIMDAVYGLALALALLMIMSAVIVQQRGAENRLSAIRSATRAAQSALFALQSGDHAPPEMRIEKLPAPAPAGYVWVRLSYPAASPDHATTKNLKDVSLLGLVPAAAIEAGGKQP